MLIKSVSCVFVAMRVKLFDLKRFAINWMNKTFAIVDAFTA